MGMEMVRVRQITWRLIGDTCVDDATPRDNTLACSGTFEAQYSKILEKAL
jgi:hypothetical protein